MGADATDNQKFSYMLLSRLQQDCKYFLGNGCGHIKHLWAGEIDGQISKMKELWESLDIKPEWLSMEEINTYETKMNTYSGDKQ